MVEDGLLEALELIARLEPELRVQQPPARAEDLERVRLSTAPVQREHELAAQALAQRMSRHERLELGDELRRSPRCQVGVDPILDGCEPQLVEACDLALGEVLVGEVGERASSPQSERLSERLPGSAGILLEQTMAFCRETLELPRVEIAVGEGKSVAGRHGLDRCGTERAAKLRDEVLERLRSGRRRRAAPELLDQTIRGDDLARVQGEKREQRTLASCAELDDATVVGDLERTEDANLHASPIGCHRADAFSITAADTGQGCPRAG